MLLDLRERHPAAIAPPGEPRGASSGGETLEVGGLNRRSSHFTIWRQGGAIAAIGLAVFVGVLAITACGGGGGGKKADEFDQAMIAGDQAALSAAVLGCVRGDLSESECTDRMEQRTQGLLDTLKPYEPEFRREQIDHALDTVSEYCDDCEQMLRDARP